MTQPGQLEIQTETVSIRGHDVARVRARGEIDLANFEELGEALSSPACAASAGILLDLREIGFVDSSGLRAMLTCAQERGDRLATLVLDGSAVDSLFEMVNVRERLNVRPSEEDALESIGAAADGSS